MSNFNFFLFLGRKQKAESRKGKRWDEYGVWGASESGMQNAECRKQNAEGERDRWMDGEVVRVCLWLG